MQLLWNCIKDEARNEVFSVTHEVLYAHQAVLSFSTSFTLICCLMLENPHLLFPFYFQGHFAVFASNFLSSDSLITIYRKMVFFHFQQQGFVPPIIKNIWAIVQADMCLHQGFKTSRQLIWSSTTSLIWETSPVIFRSQSWANIPDNSLLLLIFTMQ